MTPETPDELRARLNELAAAATPAAPGQAWGYDVEYVPRDDDPIVPDYWAWEIHCCGESLLASANIEDPTADLAFIVALVNAWPTIDAMLGGMTDGTTYVLVGRPPHVFKADLIVAPDLYRAECDCGEWDAEGPRDHIIPRWQEHLDAVFDGGTT